MSALLAALLVAAAQPCADPAAPCPGFRGHDLSFQREAGGTARDEERSAAFYAVILESAPACSLTEEKRLRAQSLFPGRKVFSSRFECDGDVENNVRYTNVDARRAFIAAYGGATAAEAGKVAVEARAKGFPGANVRRMQVVLVHP